MPTTQTTPPLYTSGNSLSTRQFPMMHQQHNQQPLHVSPSHHLYHHQHSNQIYQLHQQHQQHQYGSESSAKVVAAPNANNNTSFYSNHHHQFLGQPHANYTSFGGQTLPGYCNGSLNSQEHYLTQINFNYAAHQEFPPQVVSSQQQELPDHTQVNTAEHYFAPLNQELPTSESSCQVENGESVFFQMGAGEQYPAPTLPPPSPGYPMHHHHHQQQHHSELETSRIYCRPPVVVSSNGQERVTATTQVDEVKSVVSLKTTTTTTSTNLKAHKSALIGLGVTARRKNATRETTANLKSWLEEHGHNPYPSKGEKIMLAMVTRLSMTQVSTWFANARRRMKKENKMLGWAIQRPSAITSSSSSTAHHHLNRISTTATTINEQHKNSRAHQDSGNSPFKYLINGHYFKPASKSTASGAGGCGGGEKVVVRQAHSCAQESGELASSSTLSPENSSKWSGSVHRHRKRFPSSLPTDTSDGAPSTTTRAC